MAILGSNIVTNGTFDTNLTGWAGTNWAWDASTTAKHTAGNATALSQAAATVIIGTVYRVMFDISSMTAGTLTPSCGGVTGPAQTDNGTVTWYFAATATTAFALTPSSDFNGMVDNVALQTISVSVNFTLPTPRYSIVTAPVPTLSFTVPKPQFYLMGAPSLSVTFTIPKPRFSASLSAASVASITFTIPKPQFYVDARTGVLAAVHVTLPTPKFRIATPAITTYHVSFTLPRPTFSLYVYPGLFADRAVVLNTETMSVAEYDNFAFNSFCTYRSKLYACADDGIYVLEGSDDDGVSIKASFSTALTDFGVTDLKRIDDIILDFDGRAVIVATVGDEELTLSTDEADSGSDSGIHTERIKPGRGIRSRAFGFDVSNTNGDALSLKDIEARVEPLRRKV